MAHSQPHPKSGKHFRVNLDDGNVQAIDDRVLQGKLFRLVDWADRLEQDASLSEREKQVACMFYAHRCQPDLEPMDPVPITSLRLDGVVYGVCTIEAEESEPRKQLILIREIELEPEETELSHSRG